VTRLIDLDDDTLTENTRASYPLEFIANAMPDKKARPSEERHPAHL